MYRTKAEIRKAVTVVVNAFYELGAESLKMDVTCIGGTYDKVAHFDIRAGYTGDDGMMHSGYAVELRTEWLYAPADMTPTLAHAECDSARILIASITNYLHQRGGYVIFTDTNIHG